MIDKSPDFLNQIQISTLSQSRPQLQSWQARREMLERVLLIIALYTLINLATVRYIVDGPSMQPTLNTGQFLLISRISYLWDVPQRGDLAIFHFPGDTREDYIKRVIGLPGETVAFRGGQVYVNGVSLKEPYLIRPCEPQWCPDAIWQLSAGEYFFLGDNRNQSSDSRSFGPVALEYIVGEAVIRYWPLPEFSILHQIGMNP